MQCDFLLGYEEVMFQRQRAIMEAFTTTITSQKSWRKFGMSALESVKKWVRIERKWECLSVYIPLRPEAFHSLFLISKLRCATTSNFSAFAPSHFPIFQNSDLPPLGSCHLGPFFP